MKHIHIDTDGGGRREGDERKREGWDREERKGTEAKREERLFMGRLDGGASVPCIDSTSFQSANEWHIFRPQAYGNAARERHFLIFADIGDNRGKPRFHRNSLCVQRLAVQRSRFAGTWHSARMHRFASL